VSHLQECPRCQKRLGFLSAFKAATKTSLESGPPAPKRGAKAGPRSSLKPELESEMKHEIRSESKPEPGRRSPRYVHAEPAEACGDESLLLFSVENGPRATLPPQADLYRDAPEPLPEPAGDHPDPATLAAYFDGALKGRERSQVQRHLLGCERCMADTLVSGAGRGEGVPGEDLRAARAYFREHGSAIAYTRRSARQVQPQLELGLQDGIGTEVDFRILARPDRTSRPRPASRDVDDRIEVMVETVRVTITAHRDGRARYLDVQVRDIGRPLHPAVTKVSLEDEGLTIGSVRTDRRGKASIRVPDLPSFDLRVSGDWTIPVLLRFST
jgi:hypothetical protein